MTPLEKILEWFDSQEFKIKSEFASLAAHFHIDENIELESDEEKRIELFRNYLSEKKLKAKEIVHRTLFLKSLFDFTMDGRDSEEEWEVSRQRAERVQNLLISEGRTSTIYQNLMLDYTDRKGKWIEWCNKWKTLLDSELSHKTIIEWYFLSTNKNN